MPKFSLSKFTDLLSKYGYIIYRIFGRGGMCEYIEIVSMNWTDFFLVYIPSNYDMISSNSLELEKISEEEIGGTTEEKELVEGTHEEMNTIENNYFDFSINDIDLTKKPENAQKDLEKNYSTTIELQSKENIHLKNVNTFYRQLKRLNRCVEDIEYNVGLYTKQYLVVSKKNKIKSYYIKNADISDNTRLLVVTDFENIVYNIETIYEHIIFIKSGIYKTLKRAQDNFIKTLERLFDIHTFIKDPIDNMNALEVYLDKFHNFLEIENEKQEDKNKENEMKRSEIINNILTTRIKYETLLLKLDRALFDNAVMMSRILINFEKLIPKESPVD